MNVTTAAEAEALNRHGTYGPYRAANGHLMVAPLRFPRAPGEPGFERDLRVGDEIRYDSFAAWCAETCDHSESGPPEDY